MSDSADTAILARGCTSGSRTILPAARRGKGEPPCVKSSPRGVRPRHPSSSPDAHPLLDKAVGTKVTPGKCVASQWPLAPEEILDR